TASPAHATSAAGNEPSHDARRIPDPPTIESHSHRRGAERAATRAGCRAASRRAAHRTYCQDGPPAAEAEASPAVFVTGRAIAPSPSARLCATPEAPREPKAEETSAKVLPRSGGARKTGPVIDSAATHAPNTTSVVALVRSRTWSARC